MPETRLNLHYRVKDKSKADKMICLDCNACKVRVDRIVRSSLGFDAPWVEAFTSIKYFAINLGHSSQVSTNR